MQRQGGRYIACKLYYIGIQSRAAFPDCRPVHEILTYQLHHASCHLHELLYYMALEFQEKGTACESWSQNILENLSSKFLKEERERELPR